LPKRFVERAKPQEALSTTTCSTCPTSYRDDPAYRHRSRPGRLVERRGRHRYARPAGRGGDDDARQSGGAARTNNLSGDLYGVETLAADLAATLGGTPADAGRLSRALNEFTSEAAALLAAKPRSSVLGAVSGLHFNLVDSDGRPGSTDADYAFAAIQAGTFRLREGIPE
jgi:hypothetical protein